MLQRLKSSGIKRFSFIIAVLLSIFFGLGWICTDKPTAPVLFISPTIGDPNPATDSTVIARYVLPTNDIYVKIWIENRYGQKVIYLVDGIQNAGYRAAVWYLIDSDSIRVSSGIYIAFIEISAFQFRRYGYIEVQ